MLLFVDSRAGYLGADGIVQADLPDIRQLASSLRQRQLDDMEFARAAFEWVRDNVAHALDVGDRRVTWRAADVLKERVGLCFAKSHLLVAMLRAEGVPSGFCYQRLADGESHVLHGLVAAQLPRGWVRLDPRGNKPGLQVEFSARGAVAFATDAAAGEVDYPWVFESPEPDLVRALKTATDTMSLCAHGLPSQVAAPNGFPELNP